MSQEAVERFFGRLLTDDAFRNRAADALADTCRAEGYQLSEEEMKAITAEDLARLAQASNRLDRSIKRFSHDGGACRNAKAKTSDQEKKG